MSDAQCAECPQAVAASTIDHETPPMSLLAPILTNAVKRPKSTAVVDDKRAYTYKELVGGALFVADVIEQQTGRQNVGILLPTSGAFNVALLGCWMAKRTAVPLNYLLSPDELAYVIKDSEVDLILTTQILLDHLKLEPVIPDGVRLVRMEDLDFTGFPPLRWPPRLPAKDLAAILYTSGTSGRPKGVMLSHENFQTNVQDCITHARVKQVDTFLGVLPQFHSFGLTALTLLPMAVGAKVVYTARFIPRQIIKLMREHRPAYFIAVPSMYGALLSVKDAVPEDWQSIRFAVSGGEPLSHATYQKYNEKFHVHLLEGYGLTETAPATNWSTPWDHKEHAVGKALPSVDIKILDEHDKPLPPNTSGEIVMAGPNIMQGYFKLPDQTREVFIDLSNGDGRTTRYFRSGDIGHLDEDGFLFITGRKKEMLIIGGENVFPREIEEVLNKHEQIKDSAVIGRQDDVRGEIPIAFVELEDDVTKDDFDEAAVRAWARDFIAPFKVPREINVIDELPRNPTGKIMRRKLKLD